MVSMLIRCFAIDRSIDYFLFFFSFHLLSPYAKIPMFSSRESFSSISWALLNSIGWLFNHVRMAVLSNYATVWYTRLQVRSNPLHPLCKCRCKSKFNVKHRECLRDHPSQRLMIKCFTSRSNWNLERCSKNRNRLTEYFPSKVSFLFLMIQMFSLTLSTMSIYQVVVSGGWPLAADVLSGISHSSSQERQPSCYCYVNSHT